MSEHSLRTRASRHLAGVLLVGLGLAGCGPDDTSPLVPVHGPGGQVAFVTANSIFWQIFTIGLKAFYGSTTPTAVAATKGRVRPASNSDTIEVIDSIMGPPSGTTYDYVVHGTFDQSGDLWLAAGNGSQGSVIEYTTAQFGAGGTPTPAVAIGGFQAPEGLAFDKAGDLWALDYETDALYEFTPSQLSANGSPTPALTISLAAMTIGGATYRPRELKLDVAGNAWISFIDLTRPPNVNVDSIPNEVVAQFPAASLATSGTPSPSIVLRPTGAGLNAFGPGYGVGLALDSLGDLWVANTLLGNIVEFSAGSLTAGSNPAPAVTLTGNWESNGGLVDIAFAPGGILLVATGEGLFAYGPSQITESGSPTAAAALPNPNLNPINTVIGH